MTSTLRLAPSPDTTVTPGDPPPGPVPSTRARVIRSDEEAIAVARAVAVEIGREAAARDREKRLPVAELDLYSSSGLWALRVPRERGGADVSFTTVAEVVATIAAADPSVAQIGQSHIGITHAIRVVGTEEQRNRLLPRILAGARIGNASAEFGRTFETRLRRVGDQLVLSGRKFYATGSALSHIVAVAALDEDRRRHLVLLDRDTPGLTILDDWESFGQRTTASGTVILDDIPVTEADVLPVHAGFARYPAGAIAQIVHVAIDVGIARAAIADGIRFVREEARPARDTGVEEAWLDPYTIQTVGDLTVALHAAEAMMARGGRAIDAAWADPTEETIASASIAVAEAKVLANDIALSSTNRFFELAGTRSTLAPHAYDRHWRNARTHTVHDPVRWKTAAIGNYHLNGVKPMLGGQI